MKAVIYPATVKRPDLWRDDGVRELNLSNHDLALFGKLTVASRDIWTAVQCARYIKKRGWHNFSFMRRGSVSLQQISFTTTMIVAYSRPFAPGRGNINFPKSLLRYDQKEWAFHERLLQLRHTVYAHSDAKSYKVRPMSGLITSIENILDVYFKEHEIDLFVDMASAVGVRIRERLQELRNSSKSGHR